MRPARARAAWPLPLLLGSRRSRRLARHPELVFARTALGATLRVERERVLAGFDLELALGGRSALLRPSLVLVLAGLEALERERLAAFRNDVVRRVDDDDIRSHLRVDVAAEANHARFVELHLARLAVLVEADVELLRRRDREHVVIDAVEVRELHGRAWRHREDARRERLVALLDDPDLRLALLAALIGEQLHHADARERLAVDGQRALERCGARRLIRLVLVGA